MKQKMEFKNDKLSNNGKWKGDELFNRICKLCGEFTKLCKEMIDQFGIDMIMGLFVIFVINDDIGKPTQKCVNWQCRSFN
jgi:hypothetical protein